MLQVADRRRGVPRRHGSLFRALRRHGGDGRGFPRLFRRGLRPRSRRTSSAGTAQAGTPLLTVRTHYDEEARDLPRRARAIAGADARPAREGADDDADRARPRRSARAAISRSPRRTRAPRELEIGRVRARGRAPHDRVHRRASAGRRCRSCAASRRRCGSTTISPRTICIVAARSATATASIAGRRCRRWRSRLLLRAVAAIREGRRAGARAAFVEAYGSVVADALAGRIDPAFAALALHAAERGGPRARDRRATSIPTRSARARESCAARSAAPTPTALAALHDAMADAAPFSPDAASAGRRALRNGALAMIVAGNAIEGAERAHRQIRRGRQYDGEARRAGGARRPFPGAPREHALEAFARRLRRRAADPRQMVRACRRRSPRAGTLERVRALMDAPRFSLANPNRVRALIGGFTANPTQFNRADGAGFRFARRHRAEARSDQSADRGAPADGDALVAFARAAAARKCRGGAAPHRGDQPTSPLTSATSSTALG